MERYKPIPQSERLVSPPPATANGYREQVAPPPPLDSSIPQTQPSSVEEPVPPPIAEPVAENHASSVQIYPAPETDSSTPEKRTITADQIRAKVRALTKFMMPTSRGYLDS